MKRFLLFLSAIVLANAMSIGQSHAQYNSFCIYDNASDASLYTCASVDSITFEQHDGIISQVVWRSGERAVSPVSTVDSISFYNPYVEGIVEVSEGFDNWDKAYVTPIGYFSYKSALVDDDENLDSDQYETLAYTNFEDTQAATLILSKNDSLPVWLIIDSLTCTFGYLPEDSLCHLTIGCDSAVVCELEFHYNDSIVTARNQYTDHELKRCLWIVISLLEGNTAECQAITDVVAKFKTLLTVGEEDSEPKLPKKPISKKLKVKTDVYYGVGAGTYGAYYITSFSAVLQGCVYCASAQRDSASVYGILCDENPENLTIEKAKHNVVGYQEKMRLRYEVEATGLKPNTTYYYRAYVRIKKGKNDLQYSYAGDKAANAAYGKVRKLKTYSFPGRISKIEVVGSANQLHSGELLKDKYLELKTTVSFDNMEGVSDWCVYQRTENADYYWLYSEQFEARGNGVMTAQSYENFYIGVEGRSTLTLNYSEYLATGTCSLGIGILRVDPLTGYEYWDKGDCQTFELVYDMKPNICYTNLEIETINIYQTQHPDDEDVKGTCHVYRAYAESQVSGAIFIDEIHYVDFNGPTNKYEETLYISGGIADDVDYFTHSLVVGFVDYGYGDIHYPICQYAYLIDGNGKVILSKNHIVLDWKVQSIYLQDGALTGYAPNILRSRSENHTERRLLYDDDIITPVPIVVNEKRMLKKMEVPYGI